MRVFFQSGDEQARALDRQVEVIDTKEQQETVAGCSVIWAHQRGMFVSAPLVKAEQDSAIGVEDLAEVIMGWTCDLLSEQRLIPFAAARNIGYADDRPRTLHWVPT